MAAKNKKYSKETMEAALKMVTSGVVSLHKAAKMFNIPKTTLCDKKNKVHKFESPGHPPKLLKKEEALKEWILHQDKCGCPWNSILIKQKA